MAIVRSSSTRHRARAVIVATLVLGVWMLGMSAVHAAAKPVIVSTTTKDIGTGVFNGDGFIDRIWVRFNLTMTNIKPKISTGPGSPGVRVAGYQVLDFAWQASNTELVIILQQGTTPDTGKTPDVTYEGPNGGLTAAAPLSTEPDNITVDPSDGAGPVLKGFYANDFGSQNLFLSAGDEVLIVWSEAAGLSGGTPLDRWTSLERAIKFNNGGGCLLDGDATGNTRNFPRPISGADPVEVPANASQLAQTWRVEMKSGNDPSINNGSFVGVQLSPPCKIGVDPAQGFNAGVADAAGNLARTQWEPGQNPAPGVGAVSIQIADVTPLSAKTVDGRDGAPNGVLDAVELKFDRAIIDSTFQAELANFTVAFNGAPASLNPTFDSGTTADDDTVYLRFTAPAGEAADTGITPRVSYTKPDSCSNASASGPGIKSGVPTSGFWACAGSFSIVSTDAVAPVFVSARTTDADADGKIDRVRATFSEPLDVGLGQGWTVGGQSATATAAGGNDVDLAVQESDTPDTSGNTSIAYAPPAVGVAKDSAGNALENFSSPAGDGAGPVITTARIYDLNADGDAEHVVLEYSEPLADGPTTGFTVGGAAATLATTAGGIDPGVANDKYLSLDTAASGTDAKAIAYAEGGGVKDAAGNVAPARSIEASAVTDLARPVGTLTIEREGPVSTGTVIVTVTYSEAMDTAAAPTGTFGPKPITAVVDGGHVNGWKNSDLKVWEGIAAITSGDCTVSTGCPATASVDGARDKAGNTQTAAATAQSEIDTMAPNDPTNGTVTSPGAPDNVVNANSTNFTATATIGAGEASGGSAELLFDGNPLNPPVRDSEIGATETTISLTTLFADRNAFRTAVSEGNHTITFRLCDDAANCKTSTTGVTLEADYTPSSVAMTDVPNEVFGGGDALDLRWDSVPEDFGHVDLDYSTDGAAWQRIASDLTQVDGTYRWTVPAIDAAAVHVRATVVDSAGNPASDESGTTLSIDSSAPVVTITSPSRDFPFVGGETTVRWSATDASIDRVPEPITIEFSSDGGLTWQAINGGTYSGANDGRESWQAPGGRGFDTLVRITALDATGKTAAETTSRLATGVRGYVAGGNGEVHAFGSAPGDVAEGRTGGKDWVRGMALRPGGATGYVLSKSGKLYPFSAGGAVAPEAPGTRALRGLARGVAMRGSKGGYVVDAYGRVWDFGKAPRADESATWKGKDLARGIAVLGDRSGGYVLDAYGRLHPFAAGAILMPGDIQPEKLFAKRKAVGFVLRSDERSGWVLKRNGRLVPFGGAPAVQAADGGTAIGLVRVTDGGGYWLDHEGVLHPWGSAFGDPTVTRIRGGSARAVTAV